jgi:TPR repeat protein
MGQANLASLYFTGVGIAHDYVLAAKWFRAAADLGFSAAQHDLGVFYFKGIGLPVDYSEAARWERLAAEQGDPNAQTDLAYLYETGKGVPLDYVAAYTWYTRAISAGDRSGSARRSSLSHLLTRKQLDEATALASAQSSRPPQQPNLSEVGTLSLLKDR